MGPPSSPGCGGLIDTPTDQSIYQYRSHTDTVGTNVVSPWADLPSLLPRCPSPAPGLRSLNSSGPPGHQGPSAPKARTVRHHSRQNQFKDAPNIQKYPDKILRGGRESPRSPGFNSSQLAVLPPASAFDYPASGGDTIPPPAPGRLKQQ